MAGRLSKSDAEGLLRHCLEDGIVIRGRHFREELAAEGLEFEDALVVLRKGRIHDEPEPNVKTGEWKYRIEGYEPGGKWLAIVFCFKGTDQTFLITVFPVKSRGRR
jgi:hypothetical protein